MNLRKTRKVEMTENCGNPEHGKDCHCNKTHEHDEKSKYYRKVMGLDDDYVITEDNIVEHCAKMTAYKFNCDLKKVKESLLNN